MFCMQCVMSTSSYIAITCARVIRGIVDVPILYYIIYYGGDGRMMMGGRLLLLLFLGGRLLLLLVFVCVYCHISE